MPIIDVEIVSASQAECANISARKIADALAQVFDSAPGRVWVRLRFLDSAMYAENDMIIAPTEPPVFVTVLQAHPPDGDARAAEALEITRAIATSVGRPVERVHVQYAPSAAGRQAFGGNLVR